MTDGRPCGNRVRPGSRFCGVHGRIPPATQAAYLGEVVSGWAARPTRRHLAYLSGSTLLCTGTAAAPLPGHGAPRKVCDDCRALALAAVARGELEPDDLRRWKLGEPNVDEQ
jgi:hypothetical protein